MSGMIRLNNGVGANDGRCDDRRPVVWFEVEDFLRYFDRFRNPTGSQRVAFEIFVEAVRFHGLRGRVRFCRLSVYTGRLITIDFGAVASAYLHPLGADAPWRAVWEPAELLSNFARMASGVLANFGFFFRIAMTAVGDFLTTALRPGAFGNAVQPGDIVVTLGAAWGVPGYARRIAAAKRRYRVGFAMLVYDMIRIENRELVERRDALRFRKWLAEMVPNADLILTISQYSWRALLQFAAATGWPRPRVDVIRLGGEWRPLPEAHRSRWSAGGQDDKMRLPDRYVLFVSTIEIRKNHRLLVRVWRRLIDRHGVKAVPVLLFAGQVGLMVEDLLADLGSSGWLGGMIEHRPGLSDAELDEAYDSCLFTIFPSLCEGWGLPVAESLAHGKFCLASNRTSIPEVGGDLIDYVDPSDDDDVVEKTERLLFEPGYLAARETRLRAEYRPGTWADCARSIVVKVEQQAAPALSAEDAHECLAVGGTKVMAICTACRRKLNLFKR